MLRRLLCCAAWIEGHATHLHVVQILDLLGHANTAELSALRAELTHNYEPWDRRSRADRDQRL